MLLFIFLSIFSCKESFTWFLYPETFSYDDKRGLLPLNYGTKYIHLVERNLLTKYQLLLGNVLKQKITYKDPFRKTIDLIRIYISNYFIDKNGFIKLSKTDWKYVVEADPFSVLEFAKKTNLLDHFSFEGNYLADLEKYAKQGGEEIRDIYARTKYSRIIGSSKIDLAMKTQLHYLKKFTYNDLFYIDYTLPVNIFLKTLYIHLQHIVYPDDLKVLLQLDSEQDKMKVYLFAKKYKLLDKFVFEEFGKLTYLDKIDYYLRGTTDLDLLRYAITKNNIQSDLLIEYNISDLNSLESINKLQLTFIKSLLKIENW